MKIRSLVLVAALSCAALFSTTACVNKNAALDPAGVYHGDKFAFQAELDITNAYKVTDSFLKWELTYRALLASTANGKGITKAADRLRATAPAQFTSAENLLEAYKANPTDATKTQLTTVIAVLQAAVAEVAAYMALPLPPPPAK